MNSETSLAKVLSALRAAGFTPEKFFLFLRTRANLGYFESIRLIRSTFGLELSAAKEVATRATVSGASLEEYQMKLLEGLVESFPEPERR
jgi:hypothetical protein